MLTRNGDQLIRRRPWAVGQQRAVAGTIGNRTGIVGHAAIHRHIGTDIGHRLTRSNLVHSNARRSNQGSARLTTQLGIGYGDGVAGGGHRRGNRFHPNRNGGRVIIQCVANAQPTADVQLRKGQSQLPPARVNFHHAIGQIPMRLQLKNLGSNMGVQADRLQL